MIINVQKEIRATATAKAKATAATKS